MRILLFIQSLELGGSEKQCVEMASLLSKNGFDVTVGCMRRTGPLRRKIAEAGLTLVEFPVGSLFHPNALVQMARLYSFIRANNFNVVQANDLYANLFAIPAAKLAKVPVVVSCQRDLSDWWWYTPRRRKFLRSIQKMSTCILVNSDAIRQQLVEKEGIGLDKIRVVYNGIDVERYPPPLKPLRRQLQGIPTSGNFRFIVMVANMHSEVKGHLDLIAAAKTVCANDPNVRFLLIGDGKMRPVFEIKAREMNLQNSFLFLGHRTDIADFLARSEIGVLASHAEGLPNAVMEYMAAGLPTVATSVGGVPEIVEHNVSGLLVPPNDPNALSAALLRLLNDENLRHRLGRGARESMLSKCGFANLLSKLRSIYQAPSTVSLHASHPRESAAAD